MSIQHFPRCRVLVGRGVSPRENQLTALQADVSGYVTRCRTTKTLAAPNGQFEIGFTFRPANKGAKSVFGATLSDPRSLNQILVPDNSVNIAFDNGQSPGDDWHVVMTGLISKVFQKTAVTGGSDPKVDRQIIVTGEDWGKVLVNHDLPAHLFADHLQSEGELRRREIDGTLLNGTVKEVTERLWKSVLEDRTQRLQLVIAGQVKLMVDPVLADANRGFIFSEGIWSRHGKFWNELRGLADEPWNEMYGDYDEEQHAYVVRIRPRPFDKDLWQNLLTHEVADHELVTVEEYLGDDERVNLVFVPPTGAIRANSDFGIDNIMFNARRFDEEDAEEHGARILERASSFYDYPGGNNRSLANTAGEQRRMAKSEGKIFGNLDARADRLYRWFNINHRLWRGSWVLNGRPEIHIGQRVNTQQGASASFVQQEYARRTAYVESVIHDYVEEGGTRFFTHLGWTRGQGITEFVEPWVDGKV